MIIKLTATAVVSERRRAQRGVSSHCLKTGCSALWPQAVCELTTGQRCYKISMLMWTKSQRSLATQKFKHNREGSTTTSHKLRLSALLQHWSVLLKKGVKVLFSFWISGLSWLYFKTRPQCCREVQVILFNDLWALKFFSASISINQHLSGRLRELLSQWDGRILPEPSAWPESSDPPLKEVECCSPLAWCLKIDEESSSKVQPSR